MWLDPRNKANLISSCMLQGFFVGKAFCRCVMSWIENSSQAKELWHESIIICEGELQPLDVLGVAGALTVAP